MTKPEEPEDEEIGTGWFRTPDVLTGSGKAPKRNQDWPAEDAAAGERAQGKPLSEQKTVRTSPVPEPSQAQQPPSQAQHGWPTNRPDPAGNVQWPQERQADRPGPAAGGHGQPPPQPRRQAPQPQQQQPQQQQPQQQQPQQQQPQQPQPQAPPQPQPSQPMPPPRPMTQPGPPPPGPRQHQPIRQQGPSPSKTPASAPQPPAPPSPAAKKPAGPQRPVDGQWAQGMEVPQVQSKQSMVPVPERNAPQPASALASAPPTQLVPMPKRPAAGEPAPALAAERSSDSVAGSSPLSRSSTGAATGRRTQSRSSRGRLGAGLVDVPRVPYRDPASAVLADPEVAENKRYCISCGAKVGRSSEGVPARADGQCESCGTPFSFKAKLRHGDLVGGQYEVLGCLAYGGLGWIYLAKDHNVSDRWVVLKGLINTGDATAMASAVAERRFLAEVEHPNIVKIYNFVQHPDPETGNPVGYIVMEYVGGQSLRQIALEHQRAEGQAQPLPIGQVIAYGLEILPAMGYLHSEGLLYCDLKPDNVIQTHEQLKLIDLGAVRRYDDDESPLFFTTGYSAPELAEQGASVASDIYTVGRTLAVLSIEFSGYSTKYKYSLPGPEEVPLFALFGSYYRILRRATHPDPERRFYSAEDMAEQLTGVLREVMALGTGRPRPGVSTVFGPEARTFGSDRHGSLAVPRPLDVIVGLPVPQVDTDDSGAGVLASITATDPAELADMLAAAPQDSVEVRLMTVKARTELGDLARAVGELEVASRLLDDPYDWRLTWYRGLIELAANRFVEARAAFDAVYDALPGEPAPKLALAMCAEYQGDYFGAARFYELVWRTDRAYVSAAFGLARVYLAQGARTGAIEVLESVPDSSSHYLAAQLAAIRVKTSRQDPAKLTQRELSDAAAQLERLQLDAERRAQFSAEVLETAYGWLRAGRPGANGGGSRVLGCELTERDLRFGLERCYRALARLANTADERHALVDRANLIRPRTLV
jgi:serine/threonine-protein kinase PknG